MQATETLTADNAKLKTDLASLQVQREEVLQQLNAAATAKKDTAVAADIRRRKSLIARKDSLETQIAAAQAKKDSLMAAAKVFSDAEANKVNAAALAEQIKSLETENKALEESMGNVRENIAVLEYRINSLTRYKNRNSTKN